MNETDYNITRKDIANAEANLLPLQRQLSQKRLKVRKQLQALGVEGMLWSIHSDSREDDEPFEDLIEGELDGHEIKVFSKGVGAWGTIDGLVMSDDNARRLFTKYGKIARMITDDELYKAKLELANYEPPHPDHENANNLLKNIL